MPPATISFLSLRILVRLELFYRDKVELIVWM